MPVIECGIQQVNVHRSPHLPDAGIGNMGNRCPTSQLKPPSLMRHDLYAVELLRDHRTVDHNHFCLS